MKRYLVTEIIGAVRKNLEETEANSSGMFGSGDYDNIELNNVISATIPEAINAVNSFAPAFMLEGLSLDASTIARKTDAQWDAATSGWKMLSSTSKVMQIKINKDILRILSAKASDGAYVTTSIVPEDSPIGRMQEDENVCGSYDKPVLVQMQDIMMIDSAKVMEYKYYSMQSIPGASVTTLPMKVTYIPRCLNGSGELYSAATASLGAAYLVSEAVQENVIDELTGLILSIQGNQKAQYFFDKAKF